MGHEQSKTLRDTLCLPPDLLGTEFARLPKDLFPLFCSYLWYFLNRGKLRDNLEDYSDPPRFLLNANAQDCPFGIGIGPDGNLYITDYDNHAVASYTPEGERIRSFSAPHPTGTDHDSPYRFPCSCVVDFEGNLHVIDEGNHKIHLFDSAGEFQKDYGTGFLSNPGCGTLNNDGNLVVADCGGCRIQIFSIKDGTVLQTINKNPSFDPIAVAVDPEGKIFAVDMGTSRVEVFDKSGTQLYDFGWMEEDSLSSPWGIAIDASGRVVVADGGNNKIKIYSNDGKLLKVFELSVVATPPNRYRGAAAAGVAIDQKGRILVCDSYVVQSIEPNQINASF